MSVHLDFTLADLYGVTTGKEDILFLTAYASPEVELTSGVPKAIKYIYYEGSANKDQIEENNDIAEREVAIRYNAILAQRFAFHAGAMHCAFFDPEKPKAPNNISFMSDVEETFAVLEVAQRPLTKFYQCIGDLNRGRTSTRKISTVLAMDGLDGHSQTIDPELLYELQSKRFLALSGLPTPESHIIDFDTSVSNSVSTSLALQAAEQRPIPFVLKLQQAFAGAGTYIIRSEPERNQLIRSLKKHALPKMLGKMNDRNRHLHPSTLLLQDLIPGSEGTISTMFFVHKDGSFTYISCTQQESSHHAHLGSTYDGSCISYVNDEANKQRVILLVEKSADLLHRRGYYGPCGLDIMTNAKDQQIIVDLNVRPTGSMILGCLKGHFWERRGLSEACMKPDMKTKLSRSLFKDAMSVELENGRLIIRAWYTDPETDVSWMSLVAGGKDKGELDELMQKIAALSC